MRLYTKKHEFACGIDLHARLDVRLRRRPKPPGTPAQEVAGSWRRAGRSPSAVLRPGRRWGGIDVQLVLACRRL